MKPLSARLSLGFACVGHTYSHWFGPIFYVAVLALESELGLSHGNVVVLVVAGNLLFGFAAPLAGWLGDKWSATGMMGVFFIGTGAGLMLTGLADTPLGIASALAITGLFASIYHPVGMAWLVRNSVRTGTVLGVNGLFGGLGPATATLMTGALIDFYGWRAAFVGPGGLVVVTGLAFLAALVMGWIVETKTDRKPPPPPASRRDAVRVFVVLALTMTCGGVIYHATQAGLPKAFDESLGAFGSDGVFGISAVVAIVYAASGLMQVAGGRMADIYPAKWVYLVCYLMQAPLLLLAGVLVGDSTVAVVAVFMVCFNTSALPAENMLIARYAPSQWRAFVYGVKFVLAIGISSLGVMLEGYVYDFTGGFYWLFAILAGLALAAFAMILLLPDEGPAPVAQAAE